MSANDIRAQLEHERHIIEAATEGPWFVDEVGDFGSRTASIQGILRERYGKNAMSCGEDFDTAAFIAYARSALPVRNAQVEAVLALCRDMHAAYERDPLGDAIAYELERAIEEAA